MQNAVDMQLASLVKTSPKTRVGLVAFHNDVDMIGDGTGETMKLSGDLLCEYDTLIEIGQWPTFTQAMEYDALF